MVDIRVDVLGLVDVQRQLRRLQEMERATALSMALNKVAKMARTEADRAIRGRFAVRAGEIRSSMVLITAKRKDLEARLSIFGSPTKRGRSMNMVRFLERKVTLAERRRRIKRGSEKQLRYRVTKAGGLRIIPGSFLGNQGRTIFRRTGKSRLPIEPVQVIGVAQMFNTRTIRARVLRRVESDLMVEMTRAVDLVSSRR